MADHVTVTGWAEDGAPETTAIYTFDDPAVRTDVDGNPCVPSEAYQQLAQQKTWLVEHWQTRETLLVDTRHKLEMLIERQAAIELQYEAVLAVVEPMRILAKHAGRCAATAICDDHEQVQKLAVALNAYFDHHCPELEDGEDDLLV